MGFSCHVILVATCVTVITLRAVMGEMRVVILRGEERGVRNREGA
jgi:hypothetical protein